MIKKGHIKGGFDLAGFKYTWDYRKGLPADYFHEMGIMLFVGEQGSGKSLTAHRLVHTLLLDYPDLLVISNSHMEYCNYVPYCGIETILNADNGHKGIILFLDEISALFSSLGSKEISPEWFQIINMQRKRHLLIIGTSPKLTRVSKAFREQFDTIVLCNSMFLGYCQYNSYFRQTSDLQALNDDTETAILNMDLYKRQFFVRTEEDYKRYDTKEVITVPQAVQKGGKNSWANL